MYRRVSLITASAGLAFAIGFASQPRSVAAQAVPPTSAVQTATTSAGGSESGVLLRRYCFTCHNSRTKTAGLALDSLDLSDIGANAPTWEKVARKLRAGVMPPAAMPRPDETSQDGFVSWLEGQLDSVAAAHPDPGRTEAFHRLNRAEYQNAVRDLLALDINIADLLPADDSSYGFDNMAGVLRVSPALMERYLSTAKTLSRLAVGSPLPAADSDTYRVAPDAQQHDRVAELPFGTRGGMLVRHLFPLDGEYQIRVDVAGANRLREPHELELMVDGERIKLFTLTGGRRPSSTYDEEDNKLEATLPVAAGPHEVGATFLRKPAALVEQVREPFQNPRISGNDGGPGGSMPSVTGVTIVGPFAPKGPGVTPSRRRIFICQPTGTGERRGAGLSGPRTRSESSGAEGPPRVNDELNCARKILTALARRAYRGTSIEADVDVLLQFFKDGRAEGGTFDAGIEMAVRRLLVSPEFLFRVESDPPRSARSNVYAISDLALASRLSFFLWSSIPDDELLTAAETKKLHEPAVLERQIRRMLADPRAEALTKNFAGQWLQLRNMATLRPGDPYSLTFDETLRQSMWRETELFFESILRENRRVIDMLTADYTFLNERLAIHYGVPNVQGSHFRRVTLPADSPRRGILGNGSILTMTSHAIRTSPVFRGKWVLMNILGTPPPQPPPNVPALVDRKTQARVQTMRERMAQHRSNPSCSACHALIDPAGFALENFDAIGRWRAVDESFNQIDASGALPDGTTFTGVNELRAALVRRPERFAMTVTERLLTYALGRGLEYYDMPAVRRILKATAPENYTFQSIIMEVARSYPFLMRRAGNPAPLQVAAR